MFQAQMIWPLLFSVQITPSCNNLSKNQQNAQYLVIYICLCSHIAHNAGFPSSASAGPGGHRSLSAQSEESSPPRHTGH